MVVLVLGVLAATAEQTVKRVQLTHLTLQTILAVVVADPERAIGVTAGLGIAKDPGGCKT